MCAIPIPAGVLCPFVVGVQKLFSNTSSPTLIFKFERGTQWDL